MIGRAGQTYKMASNMEDILVKFSDTGNSKTLPLNKSKERYQYFGAFTSFKETSLTTSESDGNTTELTLKSVSEKSFSYLDLLCESLDAAEEKLATSQSKNGSEFLAKYLRDSFISAISRVSDEDLSDLVEAAAFLQCRAFLSLHWLLVQYLNPFSEENLGAVFRITAQLFLASKQFYQPISDIIESRIFQSRDTDILNMLPATTTRCLHEFSKCLDHIFKTQLTQKQVALMGVSAVKMQGDTLYHGSESDTESTTKNKKSESDLWTSTYALTAING